ERATRQVNGASDEAMRIERDTASVAARGGARLWPDLSMEYRPIMVTSPSLSVLANRAALSIARWTLFVLLMLAAFAAYSREQWQTLPPTPSLPAGTVGHRAMIDGALLWYAEWGVHDAGVPVLLLHGGPANSNYFG